MIEEYGDRYFAGGGAFVFFLGFRAVARALRRFGIRLDHLVNSALVVSDCGVYITAYKRSRPQRHWRVA